MEVCSLNMNSARPTWARSRSTLGENRPKFIVFVAGGITYSETRACQQVAESSNREIFLGSTHILTPQDFVVSLQMLREPRSILQLPIDAPAAKVPALTPRAPPEPVQPSSHDAGKKKHKSTKSENRVPVNQAPAKTASAKDDGKKKKSKKFGIF